MITENAFAKLNISLDVSGARDDGYHDMVMIMQTVSLKDTLRITLNDTGRFRAKCGIAYLPSDGRNLAVKAAMLFLRSVGKCGTGAEIEIEKNIPVGAGMAGGSTDAAAVLRCLNREFGNPLGREQLLELAAEIGSDVPYCVIGGTALAEGRGEVLTTLKDIPDCRIVICKPEFSISTPEFFKALDRIRLRRHPDTQGIISAIDGNDLQGICHRMYNVFEDVEDRRLNAVRDIRRILLGAGAHGAVMTGTGSAVFGIFSPGASTSEVCCSLEKEYGFCRCVTPVGGLL